MKRIVENIGMALFVLIVPLTASGQRNEALERLYAISDEVLIVSVFQERSGQYSAFDCSTYVSAKIVERIKTKNIKTDSLKVYFIRPIECDEDAKNIEAALAKEESRYIVFLSSDKPAIHFPPRRAYFYLSDTALGLQPYSKPLADFIRFFRERDQMKSKN